MSCQKLTIFTHGIKRGPFAALGTTLSRGFKDLGYDCDLVVLNATAEEKQRYPHVNTISLDISRAALSLWPLVRYMQAHNPDIIFSMPWYFNVIAILARFIARTPTKIIVGEHNICSLESKIEHGDKLKIKFLPFLMRASYPYSDGLIAVCQDTITDLIENQKVSDRIPMQVISNPIDRERIQSLKNEPLSHPWFTSFDVPVILTVARMAKQKQLNFLIEAFAQVIETQPAKLLILGDGLLRPELENLCKELNIEEHVSMPGYDHNPYKYMAACDIFALVSAWEGCPIALEEALASGAATIVNDAPGGSKDLVGNGEFGVVVPHGNLDALVKAILDLLSDSTKKAYYQAQAQKRSLDFNYLMISRQYVDFGESVSLNRKF